ncbi:protein STPG3 [Vipera latastei]
MQFLLNTDSPGPAAYSPPTMACRETIAPSYTFGWKTPPREGGGRRAWQKSWFMSKNPFCRKVDFNTESNWPSPSQYGQPLGAKAANRPNTPNFTFGQRGESSLVNKGSLYEPGPNQYNIERGYTLMLHRSPSIIINPVPVTLFRWVEKEGTPGPGAYNVDKGYNARFPRCPGFYIQGVRRPKKHETGPFSTL